MTTSHDPLSAARSPAGGTAPPSPAELAPHLPDFDILGLLGQGGMGAVYQVTRRSDGRAFALKVVKPGPGQEDAFTARFAREAEALERLHHPNIVAIHGHGRGGPWCWLLMDLVEGANLREVISTGRLSPAQTLALVPPLCAALQYAHDQGVVHRDLKPENILLDGSGVPHLVDFGLAKLRDSQASALTNTGATMGTLHYMAPEQVASAKGVDHRADIYALGVVIYELLTGQLPLGRFEAPSQRVQVDVRIDEVVLKALERDPERRWQQMRMVGEAVERSVAATPKATSTAPWWVRLVYRNRQTSEILAVASGANWIAWICLIVLVSVMIGGIWSPGQSLRIAKIGMGMLLTVGVTALVLWKAVAWVRRYRSPDPVMVPGDRWRHLALLLAIPALMIGGGALGGLWHSKYAPRHEPAETVASTTTEMPTSQRSVPPAPGVLPPTTATGMPPGPVATATAPAMPPGVVVATDPPAPPPAIPPGLNLNGMDARHLAMTWHEKIAKDPRVLAAVAQRGHPLRIHLAEMEMVPKGQSSEAIAEELTATLTTASKVLTRVASPAAQEAKLTGRCVYSLERSNVTLISVNLFLTLDGSADSLWHGEQTIRKEVEQSRWK